MQDAGEIQAWIKKTAGRMEPFEKAAALYRSCTTEFVAGKILEQLKK